MSLLDALRERPFAQYEPPPQRPSEDPYALYSAGLLPALQRWGGAARKGLEKIGSGSDANLDPMEGLWRKLSGAGEFLVSPLALLPTQENYQTVTGDSPLGQSAAYSLANLPLAADPGLGKIPGLLQQVGRNAPRVVSEVGRAGSQLLSDAAPGYVAAAEAPGAAIEGLLNRVGMTARPEPGQFNTFISLNQKSNLPREILEEADYASYLERQQASPQRIFEETGWLRNPLDGDWRYEVSDADAKLLIPTGAMEKLRDLQKQDWNLKIALPAEKVLQHSVLYDYLPELAQVPIDFAQIQGGSFQANPMYRSFTGKKMPIRSEAHGQVMLGTRAFDDSRKLADDDQTLGVLLHELAGHGVQARNPSASRGTNLEAAGGNYKKYASTGGEVEANLIKERKGLTQSELRKVYPFIDTLEQLVLSSGPSSYRSPFLNREIHSMGRTEEEFVNDWTKYYQDRGILK